jgi:dihydrofolate synthase / folylpolyglutamate synthase
MNLTDWLSYLKSLPSGLANKSLESVKNIARKLDVLNFVGKVITVGGTNGKGSTVIFLEAILLAAGLKTAAYTSPHVLNYRERIRLNGKDIDENTLCQAFSLVEKARANTVLSYFEFSTLAALVIFKGQNPDVLILEVGLGGRFDAVNVLDSDIAVITTISLDHTSILGDTREAIGYEKSGIIRRLKPVVCGENMPESVYQAASNLKAQLYCLNKDFSYIRKDGYWDWCFGEKIMEKLPPLNLPITSAALALMVINLLSQNFMIAPSAIVTGLKNAFLIGRFQQLIFAGKNIIFDVAHNAEAMTLLALNLRRDGFCGRILAVVSMLKDKDIAASLCPLAKVVDRWYLGALDSPRAANVLQLSQALQEVGVTNFTVFSTVYESFEQAIAECQEKDKIAVFGSFRTVAEILDIIVKLNIGE